MRRLVTSVVVYRRNAELFVSRQITSSRQSPSRSAVNVGVDFVPLFDEHWEQLTKVPPPYFVTAVPSSSSRDSSASHHTWKLMPFGGSPTFMPVVAEYKSLFAPAAHISAPGLLARMSSA